ncbi:hypothetical protein RJG79_00800 [Mycoplasmatota bacterium WC44]
MRYCINCKQWMDTGKIDYLWVIFWLIVFFPVAILLVLHYSRRIDCPVCNSITMDYKPGENESSE